ncbi:uncharacterized protein [Littorina saxatilis]|uniref:Uncharacterized protein n=1 Tax=Littorina saxatilis TaxID=31220 RepID=A0AAN9G5K0_9CAEN
MAFSVAYYDLLNKNIHHIYSGLPSNVRFRCNPNPGVTLNPHDGCLTACKKFIKPQRKTVPERLYRRLWAYSPEFGSPLPRAPAFRCVSTEEAQLIVDRLHQRPKTQHRRRECYREDGDEDCEVIRTTSPTVYSVGGHGRRCQSTEEMQALTARLSRPTTAFSIKCDLREGQSLDPVEVVHERSAMSSRSRRGGAKTAFS